MGSPADTLRVKSCIRAPANGWCPQEVLAQTDSLISETRAGPEFSYAKAPRSSPIFVESRPAGGRSRRWPSHSS